MRQSTFPIKTLKESPKDEKALNAKLLIRAGFIDKVGAGIYSYLPLGLRVIQKIENVVREEMGKIGGVELLLPALHPKEYWQKTGRWEKLDVLYKIKAKENREYALGPTHEEIVASLAKTLIQSYRDLPLYLYQIQTKFRDEPRAKSGLLRGREFLMKDLYSFHADEKDLDKYHEKAAKAYETIFTRSGLRAIRTLASGGTFSKFSDEFQVQTLQGEDSIFYCGSCNIAKNKEIVKEGERCEKCDGTLEQLKTEEVGNIFKLGTKYAKPFDLLYQDAQGKKRLVLMGCYGIGISRVMGAVVEVHHDEAGIIWPEEVAPFKIHLLRFKIYDLRFKNEQEKIYKELLTKDVEVLYDDREEVSDGQKLVEADLIGIPWRVVVSERTMKEGKVEVKRRGEKENKLLSLEKLIDELKSQ
ncbi:MAG: hypothetical protein HY001_04175 [Candidatus Portnoybacteria bacterium]|nr:hypothetical protein [Candidatus Portnoybacteria bacterium]